MLRRVVLSLLLVIGLTACGQYYDGTNAKRASVGLPPIPEYSMNLDGYANAVAKAMAVWGFGHSNLTNLLNQYNLSSCGENIGMGEGTTNQQMVDAWWASPPHRANMIGDWQLYGDGKYVAADGTVYAVQEFCNY